MGGQAPRIAFSDSTDPRILEAVQLMKKGDSLIPLLIGKSEEIFKTCEQKNISSPDSKDILEPGPENETNHLADLLLEKQKKLGLTLADIHNQLEDPLYRGVALLLDEQIDGLVAGATRPTADVVKAAIRCVGSKPGHKLVSGHFLIETKGHSTAQNTPFLFADCAVMPEPSEVALASIAKGAAESYHFFTGKPPHVALLSFSTRGSAAHALVDRIKKALYIIRKDSPALLVDGELQVDAAMSEEV